MSSKQDPWAEARRRCRLSGEEIEMAKALGFKPESLIKNIPAPSQQWKAPVNEWVRSLYERKFGSRPVPFPPAGASQGTAPAEFKTRGTVVEFRNPDHPWPDNPEIPELVVRLDAPDDEHEENDEEDEEEDGFSFEKDYYSRQFEPPEDDEIEEDNIRGLRRQCLFRWAAQSVAVAMNERPEIRKVAAFGAVAKRLEMEVPRHSQYRRRGIEILHECRDLDLAVWTADLSNLNGMKKALHRGLSIVQNTDYGGVANHQVDVHVFDAATGDGTGDVTNYKGRLCIFRECPKGKRECLVRGCGAQPFLQQFERYRFNPARFAAEPKVILVDKDTGFVVRAPKIDAKPARIEYRTRSGDDVPF